MANLNSFTLLGYLVRNPEIKTTPTGKTVAQFTLAVNKRGKDAGANFLDCTAWEQKADFLSKYGAKGSQVLVSGRIDQQTWEKDGEKKSRIIIVADDLQILSSAKPQSDISISKNEDDTINIDEIPF